MESLSDLQHHPPRLPERGASARCCLSTTARTMNGPHQSYEMNISLFTYICTAKMLNWCVKLKPGVNKQHECVRLLCSFMLDLWVWCSSPAWNVTSCVVRQRFAILIPPVGTMETRSHAKRRHYCPARSGHQIIEATGGGCPVFSTIAHLR